MNKLHFLPGAALLALSACANVADKAAKTSTVPAPAAATEQWVQIFTGKDLSGWTPKFKGYPLGENYKNTFRVDGGLLRIDYSNYTRFNGEFGHLFWKQKLTNYRIRAEYRFVGEQIAGGPGWGFRNNGIMIFSQPPETMELDQDFPASIEVQMLGAGGPGDQNNGSFCTPHTRALFNGQLTTTHRTSAKPKISAGDAWVTIEVEVRDGKITHIVDGETVISYSQPQLNADDPLAKRLMAKGMPQLLKDGYVSIQAETHPTEFRKIEIMQLPAG